MKLKLLTLLFVLWIPVKLEAQTVTVSGTAVDSDTTVWAKGTYRIEFFPNQSYPNLSQYFINGVPLSTYYHGALTGSLDNSGAFSQTGVINNSLVTPAGSQTSFTICPNASSQCGTFTMPINGSVNISSTITSKIPVVRFPGVSGSYGYADAEVSSVPKPGSTYYNVNSTCQRYFDGASWSCPTTAGGGSISGPNFITLAAQPGATTQNKFDNAVTAYSASPTTIYVDPTMPAGYPSTAHPLNTNVRVFDFRGTNCMDSNGGFVNAANNSAGPCFYAREDMTDPTAWMSRAALTVGYDSDKGGFYNWNGSSGTKSNRFGLQVNMFARTVAQNWAHKINFLSVAGGEAISLGIDTTTYGGYVSGGQEGNEGVRIQQNQGGTALASGGAWSGTVSSKTSSTVVYTTSDSSLLGESRFVRDIPSKKTGTYTAVSCAGAAPVTCTITGTGFASLPGYASNPHTTWNNLSVGGNILTNNAVFCLPNQYSSGYDACVPITTITNDTTLTVNLYAVGVQQNAAWPGAWPTSGAYTLYQSMYPTSVDTPSSTIGAADTSGITSGDAIDQVIAYNGTFVGVFVLQGAKMGYSGASGVQVVNYNTALPANQPSPGPAFYSNGYYYCGLCIGADYSAPAQYGMLISQPTSLPSAGLIGAVGGITWPTPDYPLITDKMFVGNNNQYLRLGRWKAIQIYDQDATNTMGFNAVPDPTKQFNFVMHHDIAKNGFWFEGPYPNTSMYPFSVNFDGPLGGAVVAAFPSLYVRGTGTNTNVYAAEVGIANNTPLNGYSDNQVTKTWSIQGNGVASFASTNSSFSTSAYATGSNTGGIAETYAACPSTGCKITVSQDITISTAQSITIVNGKPLVLDGQRHIVNCTNTSGTCLTFTGSTYPQQTAVRDLTFEGTSAGSSVLALSFSTLVQLQISGITIQNFNKTGSSCINFNDVEDSTLDFWCQADFNGATLQNATNNNDIRLWINLGGASSGVSSALSGVALSFTASAGNRIHGLLQSNKETRTIILNGGSSYNRFESVWMENNGDLTSASHLITLDATSAFIVQTSFNSCNFSAGTNGASGYEFSAVNPAQIYSSILQGGYHIGYAGFTDGTFTTLGRFIAISESGPGGANNLTNTWFNCNQDNGCRISTISSGGGATNTDLVGSITISGATTATQSFSKSYTNIPICHWELRFNPGTATHWDSSSITVAQVTFSSAVSGTVTYQCMNRD